MKTFTQMFKKKKRKSVDEKSSQALFMEVLKREGLEAAQKVLREEVQRNLNNNDKDATRAILKAIYSRCDAAEKLTPQDPDLLQQGMGPREAAAAKKSEMVDDMVARQRLTVEKAKSEPAKYRRSTSTYVFQPVEISQEFDPAEIPGLIPQKFSDKEAAAAKKPQEIQRLTVENTKSEPAKYRRSSLTYVFQPVEIPQEFYDKDLDKPYAAAAQKPEMVMGGMGGMDVEKKVGGGGGEGGGEGGGGGGPAEHRRSSLGPQRPELSEDAKLKRAEKLKVQGNNELYAGNFRKAIVFYGEAIELNGRNEVYYANRALAYIKLRNFGNALRDGTEAVEIDPNYITGYHRKGAALMGLGKIQEAEEEFGRAEALACRLLEATKKKMAEEAAAKKAEEERIARLEAEKARKKEAEKARKKEEEAAREYCRRRKAKDQAVKFRGGTASREDAGKATAWSHAIATSLEGHQPDIAIAQDRHLPGTDISWDRHYLGTQRFCLGRTSSGTDIKRSMVNDGWYLRHKLRK